MAYDEDLADRLRVATQHEDNLTEKRMFGGLAFLVNGNMAVAASSKRDLMVRVDPDQSAALLEEPGVTRMVMGGKKMDGWLRVGLSAIEG
jgi:TfoX/Sxy family transcriptional regulator of competence genes